MAMNLVIPPDFSSGPAAIFGGMAPDDDLGAGIQPGFGLIGYRGKTFSIRYKGDELPLMRADGDGPLNSIELVILKAPNHLSKTWYEEGWAEGSSSPPDCASSNAIVPDAGVPKPQNTVCASCKWNQFGSRPVQAGQTQQFKGKACSDNKRLAVVPLGDIPNEQFGGPLLLRIPPASLTDVESLASLLKQIGFPYYAAGVKVSFDTTVSYPKFIFKPLRPLTVDEGKLVLEMRTMPLIDKIIDGDPVTPPVQLMVPVNAPQQQQQPNVQDNVVPIQPAQSPPTQQAEPARATGFGGGAVTAPASQPAQTKTAPSGGFGGGNSEAVAGTTAEEGQATTGVAAFDAALDAKLKGLM